METNIERVMRDIEMVASFNRTPGNGFTRFSYSDEDRQARDYLINEMKRFDLSVSIDAVGNIRGRLDGTDKNAKPILVGSHIDTVLYGGKYDGLLGVVASLEVIRVIKENEVSLKHPVEVIIFSEEEGSNFGSTMAGSKALVGKYNSDDLRMIKNDNGQSLFDMAKSFGLQPENVSNYVIKPGSIKALIEMHVEQSVVLDTEGIPLGIVEAIAGIKWVKITLVGLSNHAGATPMHLRKDPMVGAAKVIEAIEKFTKEKANKTTVCTVGRINCHPNIPNAIPERVTFTVDIRDVEPEGIKTVYTYLLKKVREVTEEHKLEADIQTMGESDGIRLSDELTNIIENAALNIGVAYKKMNSGAVHDACLFGDITDVGMIFVPSINGRSHVPEENTSSGDIKIGCDVLLEVITMIASE